MNLLITALFFTAMLTVNDCYTQIIVLPDGTVKVCVVCQGVMFC